MRVRKKQTLQLAEGVSEIPLALVRGADPTCLLRLTKPCLETGCLIGAGAIPALSTTSTVMPVDGSAKEGEEKEELWKRVSERR